MKIGLLLLLATSGFAVQFPPPAAKPMQNVPEEVHFCFERNNLLSKYEISGRINPFYLRGDFDGDAKADYAVVVVAKAGSRKPGIVVCNSSAPQAHVLGAGTLFVEEEDAFDFDTWEVQDRRELREGVGGPPPKLLGEAIRVQLDESATGVIYWSGKKYEWYAVTE